MTQSTDWYERRSELEPDQVFRMHDGSIVMLDRRVPCDGTQWYVLERHDSGGWLHQDTRIEPGDLVERMRDLED
jgi:hypothetical protein